MLSFMRYWSGILLKGVDTLSKYYSIHEFSKIIGVSAQTLRNWDANGKLDIVVFLAINRKMIWNDRLIMLRHIFWQKDSHLW